jgi:hypothetical protein
MLQQLLYCGHQLQDSGTVLIQYALALPGRGLYCTCCCCGLLEDCWLCGLQLLLQLLDGSFAPATAAAAGFGAAAATLLPTLLLPWRLVGLQRP